MKNMHQEWKEYQELSANLRLRARKLSDKTLARVRKLMYEAGLDGSIPGIHLHNSLLSLEEGRPWKGVDYKKVKLANYLSEVKMWEPIQIVDRVLDRKFRKLIAEERKVS